MILIQKCHRRVKDPFPKFDIRLSGSHLHLVDLSPALLQDELEGRPVPLRLHPQGVSSQDEDEVSVLGLEDGRVEVELHPTREGNGRPLFSLEGVDLRRSHAIRVERVLIWQQFTNPSEFEDVLILVGRDGVPAGTVSEGVDDVDLVIVSWHKFLALDQTSLPVIFPSDDVDLSVEEADPEVPPLALHRLHIREGLIGSPQVVVLDDEPAGPIALADDVVAAALGEVD